MKHKRHAHCGWSSSITDDGCVAVELLVAGRGTVYLYRVLQVDEGPL